MNVCSASITGNLISEHQITIVRIDTKKTAEPLGENTSIPAISFGSDFNIDSKD